MSDYEYPSCLVIEGWIDSDGYPKVILTTSLQPSQTGQELSSLLVNWGKVTIDDGDTSIILTGAYDKRYWPPYVYRTFMMTGQCGRTYTIEAEYNGLKAKAQCQMPSQIFLDSITCSPIEGIDSMRILKVHFKSPGIGYAKLYASHINGLNRSLPSILGNIQLASEGSPMEVAVHRGMSDLDTCNYSPFFKLGDTVEVKLARIQPEVYDFWCDYDNTLNFGGSPFLSASQSLRTNIEGGYGVWSAQSVAKQRVIIR